MVSVKSFYEPDIDRLEQTLNKFFEENPYITVVDIKYAIEHNAVSADANKGGFPQSHYTALVFYEPVKAAGQFR